MTSPSSLVISKRTFDFVGAPKLITPEHSARIAWSLALRASNKSATRGKPPVISLVLETAFGILASISPAAINWPSSKLIFTPEGK